MLEVYVDGIHIPVHVRNGRGRRGADSPAGGGSSRERIVAPMPGKVIRVMVEAGDRVERGDTILILEAMKMENRLTADAAGTVDAVKVVAGDLVDGGQVLVILSYESE